MNTPNSQWSNSKLGRQSKKILVEEITAWLDKQAADIISSSKNISLKLIAETDSPYFYAKDSLRLRKRGVLMMKEFFDYHVFTHDRDFRSGEILTLAQKLNSPFFIKGNSIILFDNEQIVLCKMSGSVIDWLNNLS